jgi:hypothetical protein
MAYVIDNVSSNEPTNGFTSLLNNNFINYINGDKTQLTNGLRIIHAEIKTINTITKDRDSIIENNADKIKKIGVFAGLIYYKLALLCMKALNDANNEWEKVIAQISKIFFPTTTTFNLSKFYINPTDIANIDSIDNLVIYQLLQQLIAKDMNPNIDDVMIFMSKIDDKSIQKLEHKRKIFEMLDKDVDGNPLIKYYRGDSYLKDAHIRAKIHDIYQQVSVPGALITTWGADETLPDMEFFYIEGIENGQQKIVSIGRICNRETGDYRNYMLEIGFAATLKNFQGAGLFELISKERLKHITLKKKKKYVSYTEFDKLRDLQISFGMTFVRNTVDDSVNDGKFFLDGKRFWKLEFNSFKLLGIKLSGNIPGGGGRFGCNGIHICNTNIAGTSRGVMLTAGHCMYDTRPSNQRYVINQTVTLKYYPDPNGNNYDYNLIKNYYINSQNEQTDLCLFSLSNIQNCGHIYILDNPHDLPVNFDLALYANSRSGCGNWCNDFFKTFDYNNPDLKSNLDLFKGMYHLMGDAKLQEFKKKFVPVSFTLTTTDIAGGDSGGIVGIIFDDIKFAIIGLISGGYAGLSEKSMVPLINVSQIIGDPALTHIQYNIARYDTAQKKIIITRQSQN